MVYGVKHISISWTV